MLKELKQYENLGTPKFFWEFFSLFSDGGEWTTKAVKEHFFNKIIDNKMIFDGCLPLLIHANIISVGVDQKIIIVIEYQDTMRSEMLFRQKLLEELLKAFQKDEEFISIFKDTYYDYLSSKAIVIKRGAFGLAYSNVRRLLQDFYFLYPHPILNNTLIINPKNKKLFENEIADKLRKTISLDELKKQLKEQEVHGEEAEIFVVNYEKKRLNNKDGIEWIAPYDVRAGFDILSFHSQNDSEHNRFIEVKSYTGKKPYFYWTKNEMKKARDIQEDYLVYLVCRDKIKENDYCPIIICNPIENILKNNSWIKEIDKFYIESQLTY